MKTRKIGDIVVPKRHPELKSEIIAIGKDFAHNPLYILANGGGYIEDDLKPQAEDCLESQDFYDLMQCYRIADQADQANVIRRFKAVKDFIREKSAAPELLEALIEISEGKGRYDLDPIQHAGNCIEDMKEIALEAIKKVKE
jgi:hypothetical protein